MAFTPCKRIDIHLHLAFENDSRENPQTDTYKQMLEHFKELNIEKGIVVTGGEMLPEYPSNEDCIKIFRADPEHFAWMCSPEPLCAETVYETLKSYKENGAVGVGELTTGLPLSDPKLAALFDAAGKLGLPVTMHMSPKENFTYGVIDEPRLPLLEECLKKFPDTIFVGHSAVFWCEISGDAADEPQNRDAFPSGPVALGGRITELLEKYPNLYCDLSATSGGQAIRRDEKHGLAFLEKFADRMMFATDMSRVGRAYPLWRWLDEKAESGELSIETYKKICFKNAQRLYHI